MEVQLHEADDIWCDFCAAHSVAGDEVQEIRAAPCDRHHACGIGGEGKPADQATHKKMVYSFHSTFL
jgi:hypothetical protein